MKFAPELILICHKSHSFLALRVRNKEISFLHFATHTGLDICILDIAVLIAVKSTLSIIFYHPTAENDHNKQYICRGLIVV